MFLSTLLPATTTMTTASTGTVLANQANRVGTLDAVRANVWDAPATIPSPGVHLDPHPFPGERAFDGLQEDPTMLATMTLTGRSAAGRKQPSGERSPGFTSYCRLTQPAAAQ